MRTLSIDEPWPRPELGAGHPRGASLRAGALEAVQRDFDPAAFDAAVRALVRGPSGGPGHARGAR